LVLLPGKDLIALAQTGSGKTGAFALPILQELLENRDVQHPFFACVLSPTRSGLLSQILPLPATFHHLVWNVRGS